MRACIRSLGWWPAISGLVWEMTRRICFSFRYFILAFIIVLFAALIEYSYLNHLYLLDDIYEISGPRELSLDEKFTIQTIASDNLHHLKTFVETHCLCESVHEIHIIWPFSTPPPNAQSFFIYSHAHAIVSFDYLKNSTIAYPYLHRSPLSISTEAVLYLDIDSLIQCEDLHFMHSVWRSSPSSSGIGPFPRFVTSDTSGDLLFHGPYQVWQNARYHLVLQAAIMQHKRIIEVSSICFL